MRVTRKIFTRAAAKFFKSIFRRYSLFFCSLFCFFCSFFLFCLFVRFLKLKIYILILIRLCGRVSDKIFFTWPISGIKTPFLAQSYWLLFHYLLLNANVMRCITNELFWNILYQWAPGDRLHIFTCNHHGAEISVIWLVERIEIKFLILYNTGEKQNFEVQINFNANNTTLVVISFVSTLQIYR